MLSDDLPTGQCHVCYAKAKQMPVTPSEDGQVLHIPAIFMGFLSEHMKTQPPRFVCGTCGKRVMNASHPDFQASGEDERMAQAKVLASMMGVDEDELTQPDMPETLLHIATALGRARELGNCVIDRDQVSGPFCHGCYHLFVDPPVEGQVEAECSYADYKELMPQGVHICRQCGQSFPILHLAEKDQLRLRHGLTQEEGLADGEELTPAWREAIERIAKHELARWN